jgi:hypothetical protein
MAYLNDYYPGVHSTPVTGALPQSQQGATLASNVGGSVSLGGEALGVGIVVVIALFAFHWLSERG